MTVFGKEKCEGFKRKGSLITVESNLLEFPFNLMAVKNGLSGNKPITWGVVTNYSGVIFIFILSEYSATFKTGIQNGFLEQNDVFTTSTSKNGG